MKNKNKTKAKRIHTKSIRLTKRIIATECTFVVNRQTAWGKKKHASLTRKDYIPLANARMNFAISFKHSLFILWIAANNCFTEWNTKKYLSSRILQLWQNNCRYARRSSSYDFFFYMNNVISFNDSSFPS